MSNLFVWYTTCTVASFAQDQSAAKAFVTFAINLSRSVANIALDHAIARRNLSFAFTLITIYWY